MIDDFMIDLNNGNIILNCGLKPNKYFEFYDFESTKYYDNQEEDRLIKLKEIQEFDEKNFM